MKRMGLLIFVLSMCVVGCNRTIEEPYERDRDLNSNREAAVESAVEPAAKVGSKTSSSDGLTKKQRLADAWSLVSIVDHQYAPKEWKELLFKFSFKDRVDQFIDEVSRDGMTDEEFYGSMRRFVCSFKDGHFGLYAPTTYSTRLGFEVDRFGEEMLIVDIDERYLDKRTFPFSVGDELVAIDGIPVDEISKSLSKYVCSGSDGQRNRLIASYIPNRPQDIFPDAMPEHIEKGVTVTIYSQEHRKKFAVKMKWMEEGYPLAQSSQAGELKGLKYVKSSNAKAKSPLEMLRRMKFGAAKYYSRYDVVQPLFPLWGSFVQRKKEPIVTGVFEVGERRIGFMRIHTWDFGSEDAEEAFLKAVEEELQYFQENTDAVVIDQTYNPGGNICLVSKAASLMMGEAEAIPDMNFMVRSNRKWLNEFEWEEQACDPEKQGDDCKILKNIVYEIRESLKKGENLAGPFSVCNLEGVIRSRGNFTKPILVLINEMSISCGDVFPIIMKEGKKAKFFGVQTAGGGGNVEDRSNLGYGDFSVSITASLLYRQEAVDKLANGSPVFYVENYGAQPDFEYQETGKDYLNGYEDYKKAIEEALLEMMGK